MHLEAVPVQFVALTDGVLNGKEHILLFVKNEQVCRPYGLALSLPDAATLWTALHTILPQARQIQKDIWEQN